MSARSENSNPLAVMTRAFEGGGAQHAVRSAEPAKIGCAATKALARLLVFLVENAKFGSDPAGAACDVDQTADDRTATAEG